MSRPLRILIVEDSESDAGLLLRALRQGGYEPHGRRVEDPDGLHAALVEEDWDLVISDYTLPAFDGLAALKLVQASGCDLPFILVSGAIGEDTAVAAMKAGAHDYLMKGHLARLAATVERELHEAGIREEGRRTEAALLESNRHLGEALADLKRAQSKMMEHERLRVVGQMASGIAHDFNNALAPILGFCELLLDRPAARHDDQRLRQYLELMLAGAEDAASVVRRMRELYRQRPAAEELTSVNLSQLVQQAVALTRPRWEDQTRAAGAPVQVETDLAEVPLVSGNEGALREVLTNLIFNAVEAMPHGGTLRLRTLRREQELILEVADTGVGMTEEVRQRCFDAFFTTKGAHGTGLGLAMVQAIIRGHDGSVDLQSRVGQGTTFTLRLPIRALPQTARPPAPFSGPPRQGRILLVEDEPAVRALFAEYLTQSGHQLTVAADGRAGLEAFTGAVFDLVVTDMAMPEMNGEQLAARIHELAPATPVILLTGFGDLMKARGEKPPGIAVVVGKPVSLNDLRDAVQQALQAQPIGAS